MQRFIIYADIYLKNHEKKSAFDTLAVNFLAKLQEF